MRLAFRKFRARSPSPSPFEVGKNFAKSEFAPRKIARRSSRAQFSPRSTTLAKCQPIKCHSRGLQVGALHGLKAASEMSSSRINSSSFSEKSRALTCAVRHPRSLSLPGAGRKFPHSTHALRCRKHFPAGEHEKLISLFEGESLPYAYHTEARAHIKNELIT